MRIVYPRSKQQAVTNIPRFQPSLAFPFLSEEMQECIAKFGTRENVALGQLLVRQGERNAPLFVIQSGSVQTFAVATEGRRYYENRLTAGQFTGELDLLSTRKAFLNVEAAEDSTVLRIERPQLRRLLQSEADFANLVMQASMWRRLQFLDDVQGGVLVHGPARDVKTLTLARFLTQNCFPHQVVPYDTETDATDIIDSQGPPYVVLPDGRILSQPTLQELSAELGLADEPVQDTVYDLVVVGAGPSGLAAAVYGASEGLSTLIVEGGGPGGHSGTSSRIENYLGFPTGVSGEELAYRAQVQAQKFGAALTVACEVKSITQQGKHLCIDLSSGMRVCARSVVIATGARYRRLSAEHYDRFEGHGIHYAATAMEGNLARGSTVAVVGGGNSAGQAAVFLSGLARHVHMIVRRESLADTMSQYLIARILASDAITLHTNTEVVRLDGKDGLAGIRLQKQGGALEIETENLFVMIGAEPNTAWLGDSVLLDSKGFILTGGADAFAPSRYATSLRGVFAVGDVRSDSIKRVASAVGEGSVVISDVHRFLSAEAIGRALGASGTRYNDINARTKQEKRDGNGTV